MFFNRLPGEYAREEVKLISDPSYTDNEKHTNTIIFSLIIPGSSSGVIKIFVCEYWRPDVIKRFAFFCIFLMVFILMKRKVQYNYKVHRLKQCWYNSSELASSDKYRSHDPFQSLWNCFHLFNHQEIYFDDNDTKPRWDWRSRSSVWKLDAILEANE